VVMERYFRALDEYMQDVRRFQEGGRTKKGVPDGLIREIASMYGISTDPKKSKNLTPEQRKKLIAEMRRLGVSVEQFARAINRPVSYIRKFVS